MQDMNRFFENVDFYSNFNQKAFDYLELALAKGEKRHGKVHPPDSLASPEAAAAAGAAGGRWVEPAYVPFDGEYGTMVPPVSDKKVDAGSQRPIQQ
jgi:hypothetical protein